MNPIYKNTNTQGSYDKIYIAYLHTHVGIHSQMLKILFLKTDSGANALTNPG